MEKDTLINAHPHNPILERNLHCTKNQIDLSPYYTESVDDDIHHKPGNTLADLPKGLQSISGVAFDLRGVVQLAGHRSGEITTLTYPKKVSAINVNQNCQKIHFLHASAWNIDFEPMEIGYYQVNYYDNTLEKIKLVYRENIWDWWSNDLTHDGLPVWKGTNERTLSKNGHIRLFMLTWKNPYPEKDIASLDLVSNCKGPGPMIIAITSI